MDLYDLKEPSMNDLAIMKGFRKDYWVKVSNAFYQVYFYTWDRFDFEYSESKNDGYFVPDINCIVLPSVDEDTIIATLKKMGSETIKTMKPCEEINGELFFNLSSGEKRVYSENGWRISCKISNLSFVCHLLS